jgi:3-oxoacyl-[acyl-carrier protein] reductase
MKTPESTRRVALVTGAGQGIGEAIAVALAQDGAAVAVNDRNRETAEAVSASIRDAGGTAEAFVADLIDLNGIAPLIDDVVGRLGPVDVLISNASKVSSGKSLIRTPLEEVEEHFRLNAVVALALCQAVLPAMRERLCGDIVLLTSIAAQGLAPKGGPYNMAKSALEAMALTLAKEEAKYGIRVNLIAPAFVDTPSGRYVRDRIVEASGGSLPNDDPMWSLKPPSTIADVVRFFLSPAAEFVTGQRVTVGGIDPRSVRRG